MGTKKKRSITELKKKKKNDADSHSDGGVQQRIWDSFQRGLFGLMLKDETVTGSRHRRNKVRMDSGLGGEKSARFVQPAALEESIICLNMSTDLNKQPVCCHPNVWEEE